LSDDEGIYQKLYAWLMDHIAAIPCADERMRRHLDLKRTHSLRVAGDIALIGRQLGLSGRPLLIARTIGLLHDVGRFEQYKIYRTYNDRISTDHGALGVRIVSANGLLAPFSADEVAIITRAIGFHNKIALPEQEPVEVLFFLKMIRDADKLDIYRVILENMADAGQALFEAVIPTATDVSEAVYSVLMRGGDVDYQLAASGTDRLMMHVGWVFDINFAPTLQLIAERDCLEGIAAALPQTPRVAQVLAKARAHLSLALAKANPTSGIPSL
jgi:hypothetical protein